MKISLIFVSQRSSKNFVREYTTCLRFFSMPNTPDTRVISLDPEVGSLYREPLVRGAGFPGAPDHIVLNVGTVEGPLAREVRANAELEPVTLQPIDVVFLSGAGANDKKAISPRIGVAVAGIEAVRALKRGPVPPLKLNNVHEPVFNAPLSPQLTPALVTAGAKR